MRKIGLITGFVSLLLLCGTGCVEDHAGAVFVSPQFVPKYNVRVYTDGGREVYGEQARRFVEFQHVRPLYSDDTVQSSSFPEPTSKLVPSKLVSTGRYSLFVDFANFTGQEFCVTIGRAGMWIALCPEKMMVTGNGTRPVEVYKPELDPIPFGYRQPLFFVFRGGLSHPRLSVLAYKLVKNDPWGGRSVLMSISSNELDLSCLQQLTERDTLAVQEYEVQYALAE